MAYTKYSLTPANNNAAPPDGAPEGMLPSAVNDTMRDMMAQIRDVGDGIRGGTYTMTAPVITGGTINGATIGATTASTGAFSTLSATGVATFSAGTISAPAITTTGDTNTGIFFPAADTIAFTEGGVESMRLNSSGVLVTTNDASISGLTVGKGGGTQALNTSFGVSSLSANTTGNVNTSVGYVALLSNTTGAYNTAFGANSLQNNTTSSQNTAIGFGTLNANTGGANTALGNQALYSNTTASSNTAVGYQAAFANTTGQGITAIGKSVLSANTTGYSNVGVGGTRDGALSGALISNTTGNENIAMGVGALAGNTTGSSNVGLGHSALQGNTTATNNTAVGYQALTVSATSTGNTAFGYRALYSHNGAGGSYLNCAIGNSAGSAITDGYVNCILGADSTANSLTSGAYNTYIGTCDASAGAVTLELVVAATNPKVVGKGTSTAFITANGGSTYNGANTTTWATVSDRRIKKNIVDNNDGLSKLTGIQVRNFEYRLPEEVDAELKPTDTVDKQGVQLGVIAQELQQVLPDCIKAESTGVLSVQTDNLIWYLVNAVKELNAKVEAQALEIATLKGN